MIYIFCILVYQLDNLSKSSIDDCAGPLRGVIFKTFGTNSACFRFDVEISVLGASNTSFSVPDWLVLRAGFSSQGSRASTRGIVTDALQLIRVKGVSGGTADALSLTLVPV
jgi:hypothetical protein